MSVAIDGLLFGWKKNLDYAQKLVADLSEEQMAQQPVKEGPAANHPAWVLSHLNAYLPVLRDLISGNDFEDPKGHPFGMQSKPESDRSIYASKDELVNEYVSGHEDIASLLKAAGDAALEKSVNLERWSSVMPKVGIALPYLMLVHENIHLGQLSAWRRVQGMPSV